MSEQTPRPTSPDQPVAADRPSTAPTAEPARLRLRERSFGLVVLAGAGVAGLVLGALGAGAVALVHDDHPGPGGFGQSRERGPGPEGGFDRGPGSGPGSRPDVRPEGDPRGEDAPEPSPPEDTQTG